MLTIKLFVAFCAMSLVAIFFVWKWKLWRKENLLSRERLVAKIVLGLVILFLAEFWVEFGYKMYKILNGFVPYNGKWYADGKLPPEATEEWGEYRKQLREAPTVRGPEETYKLFRQALLDENFEEALGYVSDSKKETYANIFEDKIKVSEWVKKLPEKIEKESNDEFNPQYGYVSLDKNDKYYHYIRFSKNLDGTWTIDSI